MKYGYFPGCSLHSTGIEYNESFKAVASLLDIELEEVKDWVCCGSTPAHVVSHLLSIALPIHNLALYEEAGYSEIAVPCAACYARFKKAIHETGKDPALAADVEYAIGRKFEGKVKPLHPLETFMENLEQLQEKATETVPNIKVACYYGCLLVRPPEVMGFDDCEYPMSMDNILRGIGYETVDWSSKTDCCGAALSLSETDIVLDLTQDIYEEAKGVGADAIAVACSMCHINLDTRQGEVDAKFGSKHDIPILYFTQLLGLAMGIKPVELGLHRHFIDPMPLLTEVV